MKRKYQSKIMEAIHEEAQALFEIGSIGEERMVEYDHACFISKPDKTPGTIYPIAAAKGIKSASSVHAHQN